MSEKEEISKSVALIMDELLPMMVTKSDSVRVFHRKSTHVGIKTIGATILTMVELLQAVIEEHMKKWDEEIIHNRCSRIV